MSTVPSIYRRRLLALLGLGLPLQGWAKNALSVLLAKNAPSGINPTGYLVSEKFDGVRAVWDGEGLRFRSGQRVNAPAWFLAKLPQQQALDGELWLGKARFDELSGIVRRTQPVDSDWRQLSYLVFELPDGAGSFTKRHERMREIVRAARWSQLKVVEQFTLNSEDALQRKLAEVIEAGGEGLVLHRADAPYVTGRSDLLLKYKPQADAEAVVTAHIPGHGKYAGLLGALQVTTPQGQVFKLGTGLSDEQRRHPPPIGATITYIYRDTTPNGKPRFASFLRVRDGV
jgi:DNA ligase 1